MINRVLPVLFLVSCGLGDTETSNKRSEYSYAERQIDELKKQVAELTGTISQINSFVSSDYTDCNASLPDFEEKLCQVARTVESERSAAFISQLSELSKIFQRDLYGSDCLPDIETFVLPPGCPLAGSIMEKVSTVEVAVASHTASLATISGQITSIQGSISTIQSDISGLQGRLNNFNGSGQTAEVVISGIQSTLSTLNSRVTAVEAATAPSVMTKLIEVCKDVSPTVGPVYDILIMQLDNSKVSGYIQSGTKRGLGVIKAAGGGDGYYTTAVSSLSCKFRVYDLGLVNGLRVCWHNTNRSAGSGTIDTACVRSGGPSGGSVTPGVNCTCKN